MLVKLKCVCVFKLKIIKLMLASLDSVYILYKNTLILNGF